MFPWSNKFQGPADIARILSVSYNDSEADFELVGTVFHSNLDQLTLRYVKSFADENDGFAFPDDFAEALSNLLAAELSIPMTQTPALRDMFLNMYSERIGQARFNGSVERQWVATENSSWVNAHNGTTSSEIDPRVRGLSGY